MSRLFNEDGTYTEKAIQIESDIIAAISRVLKDAELKQIDKRDLQFIINQAGFSAGLEVILDNTFGN
jgi:hypothetical protein